jgi:hypothetical protein
MANVPLPRCRTVPRPGNPSARLRYRLTSLSGGKRVIIRNGDGLPWRSGRLSDSNLATTFLALVIDVMQVGVVFAQKSSFAALKAICANPMNWFAATHRTLQDIGIRPGAHALKFIARLLCVPRLQLSYLLFKFALTLQELELLRLYRKCARLGGHDLSRQFVDLRPDQTGVADVSFIVFVISAAALSDVVKPSMAASSTMGVSP